MFKLAKINLLFVSIFGFSCSSSKTCWKEKISDNKFVAVIEGKIHPENFIIFSDSSCKEFGDGIPYSVSKVKWLSCDRYFLIIKELFDTTDAVLGPGDTLDVSIKSISKDTLTCVARALNFSAELKYLRVER